MPSLKSYRDRIKSVDSTKKITTAMKMVAASKLRRAQEQAESSRPYADFMERMLEDIALGEKQMVKPPKLLTGTGKDETRLLIIAAADRGLCGTFNSSIIRRAKLLVHLFTMDEKKIKIFCVGRKAREALAREYGDLIVGSVEGLGRPRLSFHDAQKIAQRLLRMYERNEFDNCTIVYNRFESVIKQTVHEQRLIPVPLPEVDEDERRSFKEDQPQYDYEPSEEEILLDLLPRNLAMQIYRALLENAASEQGARMTAMDNATRNAGDMIKKLKLKYNRTRQDHITTELIEIISGAAAL